MKAEIRKINNRESLTAAEISTAATAAGVATTDQGRPRDPHSIAADLARTLGRTVTINY